MAQLVEQSRCRDRQAPMRTSVDAFFGRSSGRRVRRTPALSEASLTQLGIGTKEGVRSHCHSLVKKRIPGHRRRIVAGQ